MHQAQSSPFPNSQITSMRRTNPPRQPIRHITRIAARTTPLLQIPTRVHRAAIVDPRGAVEAGHVIESCCYLRCEDLLQAVAGGCPAGAVLDLLVDFGGCAGSLHVAADGCGAGDTEGLEVGVAGSCAVVAGFVYVSVRFPRGRGMDLTFA